MISRFLPILSKLKALRRHGRLMWLAFRDPITPLWIKLAMAGVLAYLISPIDVVPDLLVILGITDDLVVITLAMWILGKFIPQEVKDKAALENAAKGAQNSLKV